MKPLILLLLTLATATAAPVTIQWNPNPESGITYRLYRGIELLGTTTATQLEVNLPADQQSTLTVTAVSAAGLISQPSKRLVVAPIPIEDSANLTQWRTRSPVLFHTLEKDGIRIDEYFFRFNLTYIQPTQ